VNCGNLLTTSSTLSLLERSNASLVTLTIGLADSKSGRAIARAGDEDLLELGRLRRRLLLGWRARECEQQGRACGNASCASAAGPVSCIG
jgi:hypothetical protein